MGRAAPEHFGGEEGAKRRNDLLDDGLAGKSGSVSRLGEAEEKGRPPGTGRPAGGRSGLNFDGFDVDDLAVQLAAHLRLKIFLFAGCLEHLKGLGVALLVKLDEFPV